MKITRILQQERVRDRYSIFVDGAYAFSLSEQAVLQSGLVPGLALTAEQMKEWKRHSADDKIYGLALKYAALRLRSVWEMDEYLRRKGASPALIEIIRNKLSDITLLDDRAFACAFVATRRLLRPSSKLKLQQELGAKRISEEIIEEVLGDQADGDQAALLALITKKRALPKFRTDTQKLMQYLARQGFSYEDIKNALKE